MFSLLQMRSSMADGDEESRADRFVTHVDLSEPFVSTTSVTCHNCAKLKVRVEQIFD